MPAAHPHQRSQPPAPSPPHRRGSLTLAILPRRCLVRTRRQLDERGIPGGVADRCGAREAAARASSRRCGSTMVQWWWRAAPGEDAWARELVPSRRGISGPTRSRARNQVAALVRLGSALLRQLPDRGFTSSPAPVQCSFTSSAGFLAPPSPQDSAAQPSYSSTGHSCPSSSSSVSLCPSLSISLSAPSAIDISTRASSLLPDDM